MVKNKDILNKGEITNTPYEKISSINIEDHGLLIQDIIVKKFYNSLKVSFLDANDKMINLPSKFCCVSIWLARQKYSPYYLGTLSYGKFHCGSNIQYQLKKNLPEKDILNIFISLEGKPKTLQEFK